MIMPKLPLTLLLLLQATLIKSQSAEDLINLLQATYDDIHENRKTLLEDLDFVQEDYSEFTKFLQSKL